MKNSIFNKIFIAILSFVIIVISISFILNVNFLKKYYINKKFNSLVEQSEEIKKIYLSGNNELFAEIEKEINGDISIYYFDNGHIKPLYSNSKQWNVKIGKGLFPLTQQDIENVLKGNMIKSIFKHPRLNTEFLYLSNLIEKNMILVIMIPIASINESINIFKEFYIYIGIISLFIGVILAFIISKYFTKPILKLNNIAKNMSELKFDKKYLEKRHDEIGQLGISINILSDKLNSTINELNKANEKLKEDIDRKIQIDKFRKEFISSVSHELKTPISLIKGYTEGLKDNILKNNEDKLYYCDVIIDETNKMDKLVKELLEISKLESGQIKLDKEEFNISKLIREIIDKYNKILIDKNIKIKFENNKDYIAFGDKSKFEIVISNFLNNAIDHIYYENEIEFKIIEYDDILKIKIKNSGQNIPESEMKRIWESFYKVDKSRNRKYGGTGLGLSIVKSILSLHESSFGVYNEKNSVVFWFDIKKVNK